MISTNLANKISKVSILPKSFSDHNPVHLLLKRKISHFRWRLNETILQKEKVIEDCKKKLNEYFDSNLEKGTT